jgi:hypothetical protein
VALRYIAEKDNDARIQHLRNGREPSEHLYKKFKPRIIYNDASEHNKEVAEELRALSEVGSLEHNEHAEVEPDGERDNKRKKKRSNVWLESDEVEINQLLVKDKVVRHKIEQKRKKRIATTTGSIAKSLQRHEVAEQRVKKVDEVQYPCPEFVV